MDARPKKQHRGSWHTTINRDKWYERALATPKEENRKNSRRSERHFYPEPEGWVSIRRRAGDRFAWQREEH